ncbi:hypothetical protein [Pseudomonas sp. NPDC089534]|uniref:hypothetical protein n=1 Tax=Pseudomonas sp. NPDC089534 TaxID=3364468 RepID=UPI00382A4EF5
MAGRLRTRLVDHELQSRLQVAVACLSIADIDRDVTPMKKYKANAHQPDICMSLSSEWLTEMMKSPDDAIQWCQRASLAEEDDEFYVRHLKEQAELTSSALIKRLKDEQAERVRRQQELQLQGLAIQDRFRLEMLEPSEKQNIEPIQKDLSAYKIMAAEFAAQELEVLREQQPITESLKNKTTDKAKLLEIRSLRVIDEKTPITLKTLTDELQKLEDTPRYYLIGVKARKAASHALAIVSTKSSWLFGSNGQLHYYDPNLHYMVTWNGRAELKGFLERSLLVDYESINHIWQLKHV